MGSAYGEGWVETERCKSVMMGREGRTVSVTYKQAFCVCTIGFLVITFSLLLS